MAIFTFCFFLVFFCFCVIKIPFFKKSGLRKYWLIGLFLLKVFAGILYGWFYTSSSYIQGSDTWRYFNASKTETDWLLRDPVAFVKDLFIYSYNSSGNLFASSHSYWNNLKDNVIIKMIAIVNVITLKNYYADVVFFNFVFFFGPVAFYRLIKEKIVANKLVLIAFVFCMPSFLFWCSGLHKDGFIFMSVALISFYFNEWIKTKRFSIGKFIILIICTILLFALKNFVLILLIPALITWCLCEKYPSKKILVTTFVYGLCVLMFFISPIINHYIDFPNYVVTKQNEFKALGGNSQLSLPSLQPAFVSFISFLPYAIDVSVLRPHVDEIRNMLYVPAILENIFIYILVLYSVIVFYKKRKSYGFQNVSKAFLIFCFAFAISNLIVMGYTVTLTGAIVRYRSFVLPFLVAPLSLFIKNNPAKI